MLARLASLLCAVLLALVPSTARVEHGLGHPSPHEVAWGMMPCLSGRLGIPAVRFQIDGEVFGDAEIANIEIDGERLYHIVRHASADNLAHILPTGVHWRDDDPALLLVTSAPSTLHRRRRPSVLACRASTER